MEKKKDRDKKKKKVKDETEEDVISYHLFLMDKFYNYSINYTYSNILTRQMYFNEPQFKYICMYLYIYISSRVYKYIDSRICIVYTIICYIIT